MILFLSSPSNRWMISSKEILSDKSYSIDKTVISLSRCSDIVVRKWVLIRFNAENDLSHWAVLTTVVNAICNKLFNVGKAAPSGKTILKAFNTESISLPCKTLLASEHSLVSRECPIHKIMQASGFRQAMSRNFCEFGLQACKAFMCSRFTLENLRSISDRMWSYTGW